MTENPNQEQSEYWNQQAGPKWVELQSFIDAQIEPLGLVAMEGLGVLEGRQVLDVGCGCGGTSLELARRVGGAGSVLGMDLSRPMLDRAVESARDAGLANVEFRQADAQTESIDQGFDALFSRFGVMFFSDPAGAFANLRKALKPGASLAFVCWRSIDQNEWMIVPAQAALQHLPPPDLPAAGAPGPFAFADEDRVRSILGEAGFRDIEVERHDRTLTVGGGRPLDEIVDVVMQMGPAGRLLRDATDEVKSKVAVSIHQALQPFGGDGGLEMRGSTWMVRARNA